MKNIVLFTALLFSFVITAQKQTTYDEPQWKIRLFFEDATGAKDTLTIGYDPSAGLYTGIIDPQFNEDWIEIDPTVFNVYLAQFNENSSNYYPEWPNVSSPDNNLVRKKSITSWPYPGDDFVWMNGVVPITMTWEEPKLDSHDLPANFPDLEPYPRARIDIWIDYWFECVFPDCESQNYCDISDPQPPLVILTSYTNYVWQMAPCRLSQPLIWDTDSGIEIDENAISVPYLIVTPFMEESWIGIDELENQIIKIYPNPTDSFINIRIDNTIETNYSLYDILGNKHQEGILKTSKEQINIDQLPSGVYFLKIDYRTFRIIKL